MSQKEARGSERRPLFYAAWIEDGAGGSMGKCVLSDISESGAKVRLETTDPIPERFILRFAADGAIHRECRVVWRNGQDLGVAFITPLSAQSVLLATDVTNWTVD